MSAKFTVTGGDTKITFDYTAVTGVVLNIVNNAAEYLWVHGYGNHGTPEVPILFSSLNNQKKLDLIDTHVKYVIRDLANTNKSIKAQDLARATEDASKLDL